MKKTLKAATLVGLAAVFMSNAALSSETATETCVVLGKEVPIAEGMTCYGNAYETLRTFGIERERVVMNEETKEPEKETYMITYKMFANYAAGNEALGNALKGVEVPQIHNGVMETGIITAFVPSDEILAPQIDAIKEKYIKEEKTAEELSNAIANYIGSMIMTRPQTKADMWNNQKVYNTLGSDMVVTNFLSTRGDTINGRSVMQYDLLTENAVIHLLN